MISYLIYDLPTGRILSTGAVTRLEDVQAQIRSPRHEIAQWVEADERVHYMVDGVVTPRPAMPGFDTTTILANGADAAVLDLGVEIERCVIDGVVHMVSGGRVAITADVPDTYRVEITAFPYLDLVAEIVAVEAL